MLISDGKTTRSIAAERLSEYAAKGYSEVKKPKPDKKGKQ